MADIGPSTDNETLADVLAEALRSPGFKFLDVHHQEAINEAEQRIRELPDEEDS